MKIIKILKKDGFLMGQVDGGIDDDALPGTGTTSKQVFHILTHAWHENDVSEPSR